MILRFITPLCCVICMTERQTDCQDGPIRAGLDMNMSCQKQETSRIRIMP